jgi:hypothetical protein
MIYDGYTWGHEVMTKDTHTHTHTYTHTHTRHCMIIRYMMVTREVMKSWPKTHTHTHLNALIVEWNTIFQTPVEGVYGWYICAGMTHSLYPNSRCTCPDSVQNRSVSNKLMWEQLIAQRCAHIIMLLSIAVCMHKNRRISTSYAIHRFFSMHILMQQLQIKLMYIANNSVTPTAKN